MKSTIGYVCSIFPGKERYVHPLFPSEENPFEVFRRLDAIRRLKSRWPEPSILTPKSQWEIPESLTSVWTRSDDEAYIEIDLPGYTREEIDVDVLPENKGIEIKATSEKRGNFHSKVALPEHAVSGEIRATYINGVLKISTPLQVPQSRRVEIS